MQPLKVLAIGAVAVGAGGLVAILAGGAVAARAAMQPARHTVAGVCPCIARVTRRGAAGEGDQSGWYFVPDNANGSAILMLHGIGATREDMIGLGAVFLRAGYSVLVPDLRGFGRSRGVVTYGEREARDVQHWAEWLARQPGVARLYGFGVSLGGTALLESLDYESRFRAVVTESAFSDFASVANERMSSSLPPAWQWTAAPLVASG